MGGKTSTQAKNKYNSKAYEQIPLRVKKGQKEQIQEYAKSKGYSLNSFINKLVADEMGEKLTIPKQQDE